ncbi:MAG TPA: hypothetical protein VLU99_01305 [Nitrososphaerales archaeon]|nr:hypothetical protein [Nitrososphaerales archaeon]
MPIDAGEYVKILEARRGDWKHVEGEPEGMDELLLHTHPDGSYTHLLRVKKGVEIDEPVKHEFFEEAYYLEGEMLATNTNTKIVRGMYVFHEPGEEHGPFKCLKTCLILEFRYYTPRDRGKRG